MNLGERFSRALEADKKNYKHSFYDPKLNRIVFVKERYLLTNNKRYYYDYADEELYGKHVLVDRAKHWFYLGEL